MRGLAAAILLICQWSPVEGQASAAGKQVRIIERTSDGRRLFKGPVGARCHGDGRLFVVDDLAHRLLVFDRSGDLLQSLGGYGSEPGQLLWPDAIHWDAGGALLVADTGANQIQVWSPDGRYLSAIGRAPRWRRAIGSLTAGLVFGGLRNPRDVLVGDDGLVYVSDHGGDKVRAFSRDGALVRSIGGPPGAPGALRHPLGLALTGGTGPLFVADGDHRVQVFSRDGTFVRSLGRRGAARGELDSPHGLAVDAGGLLYIADRGNKRVQVWTQEGAVVDVIGPDIKGLRSPLTPAGLCITSDGMLAVVDLEGHRVVILPTR